MREPIRTGFPPGVPLVYVHMVEPLDEPPPRDYRVLVTGDQNWRCRAVAREVIERLKARHGARLVVVHGAAAGVDSTFAAAASIAGVTQEPYPADWRTYGRSAGPRRDAAILASGIDLCLVLHRTLNRSGETRDCVAKCLAAGIQVWLVDSGALPVRPRRFREVWD